MGIELRRVDIENMYDGVLSGRLPNPRLRRERLQEREVGTSISAMVEALEAFLRAPSEESCRSVVYKLNQVQSNLFYNLILAQTFERDRESNFMLIHEV